MTLTTISVDFSKLCSESQARLSNGNCSSEAAAGLHKRVTDSYKNIQAKSDQTLIDLNPQLSGSIVDERAFELMLQTTTIQEKTESVYLQFTNQLLTSYPTAKIDYRVRCVSEKSFSSIPVASCIAKRDVGGDGNCFYTSMVIRYLELIAEQKSIEHLFQLFEKDGINDPVLKEELVNIALELCESPSSLEKVLGNNHKILPFVAYFRKLAYVEMLKNPDQYQAPLRLLIADEFEHSVSNRSYPSLLQEYVLQMGIDATHPAIVALCKKMEFQITIHEGSSQATNILNEGSPKGVFYRISQHYFVLYPNSKLSIPAPAPRPAVAPSSSTSRPVAAAPAPSMPKPAAAPAPGPAVAPSSSTSRPVAAAPTPPMPKPTAAPAPRPAVAPSSSTSRSVVTVPATLISKPVVTPAPSASQQSSSQTLPRTRFESFSLHVISYLQSSFNILSFVVKTFMSVFKTKKD